MTKKRIKKGANAPPNNPVTNKATLKAAVKPDKFPEWAKNLVQDEHNKEFNRYEPPQAKKDVGWSRGEVPPRQWINYLAWLTNQWLEYLHATQHKPTQYATKTDLPDPAANKGSMAYVLDTNSFALCDGSAWVGIRTQNL